MNIQEMQKTVKELQTELKRFESDKSPIIALENSFSNAKSRKDINFENLHSAEEKKNRLKREISFFEEKIEEYRVLTEPAERKTKIQTQVLSIGERINDFGTKLQEQTETAYKGFKSLNFDTLYKLLGEGKEAYSNYINGIDSGYFGNQHGSSLRDAFFGKLSPIEIRIYTSATDGIETHLDDELKTYAKYDIFELLNNLPNILELQLQLFNKAFKNIDLSKNLIPQPKDF